MKPSHRKDVIIARIIFACLCVALIAIIASIVVIVSSHNKSNRDKINNQQEAPQLQDQKDTEGAENNDDQLTDDNNGAAGDSQVEELTEISVKTTTGVNLRSAADKESEILATIPENTELTVIEEENDWVKVEYDGKTGYVYNEFVRQVIAEPEGEAGTAAGDGAGETTGDDTNTGDAGDEGAGNTAE